jgi:hypothetical protein
VNEATSRVATSALGLWQALIAIAGLIGGESRGSVFTSRFVERAAPRFLPFQ